MIPCSSLVLELHAAAKDRANASLGASNLHSQAAMPGQDVSQSQPTSTLQGLSIDAQNGSHKGTSDTHGPLLEGAGNYPETIWVRSEMKGTLAPSQIMYPASHGTRQADPRCACMSFLRVCFLWVI